MSSQLTPAQIVDRLDQTIVGQKQAKRSVAVALRNRYRRSKLDESLKEEITPKNILMIGPTGVGKTEIARRLAKLVGAPFIKVEATKFTEVGYVGRDVESMIRDLVETSVRLVQEEKKNRVKEQASKMAEQRLVELLHPNKKKTKKPGNNYRNPLEMFFQEQEEEEEQEPEKAHDESYREARKRIQEKLSNGEMEEESVTLTVEEQGKNFMDMFQGGGMDQMGMNMQDMFGSMMPKQKKERTLPVKEARKVLTEQEAEKLINMEEVTQEAIDRAEQLGIIFIDEIDKVAGKSQQSADVSREGVQRDILPIIEGSTVVTKHGAVKTDHMLFIGAGAFHFSKPSDLIPELQGRLPIRVELDSLGVEDFVNILTQPKYALLKQYEAMLAVEGIKLSFETDAVRKIAEIAAEVNDNTENIGARRLHTIMERLLEDLSFEASEITMDTVAITANYVEEKLADVAKNRDVSQYIL